MAKARGKKITIEDALVPIEEQPYEVPENWCWTYLLTGAAECMDAYRKPINATERASREGDIPYYGATGQVGWIDDYLTDEQLVLLGEDGAPFLDLMKDKAYIIEGKAWVNNHAHILKSLYGETGNRFLMYYLNTFNYHGFVNGTTRLKLTQASMNTIPVPLPPLPEQQRIVEQIESLFSKLDEAKDKAQRVLDSVEDRRLSILNAAYSGRLTTNWRNGAEASFKTMLLSEICTKITDGFHNSPKPVDEGYPYVMAGCVKEQGIDYYNGLYMDEKNHRELYNKAHPEKGDILMVNIGAGSGTAAIIDVDFEFSFKNSAILKLKKDIVNPYYVLYYLWLRKKYLLIEVTRGGAQPFLSLKIINNISIPICSLDEQYEIVKIVDSILQIENSIKDKQERVIETADIVKKSILAKAFRGELGTNNPDEECSLELLKRMIEE